MGHPTVHPAGVTIYNPEKCFNGYTIFHAQETGATLIDMNGGVVNLWEDLLGFPSVLLKGGYVIGNLGERNTNFGFQDQIDLVQVDWDGNIVWKFNQLEYVEDPGEEPQWMARQHHDFQREGNPVGYYVPGMEAKTDGGNTLILCHHNLYNHEITDKNLLDDKIIEIDWQGNIIWEWTCNEHFHELGFSNAAKNALFRDPNQTKGGADWMHINCMAPLGPNKWYDSGDERFHPDNIILDGRQTNIMAIISKETGKIVWKLGPYFGDEDAQKIGPIIGQHHTHMIPQGLPGAGNILIFDNGGWAGYDVPNEFCSTGNKALRRDHSRVLEIDPTTMKIVWQFTPREMGCLEPFHASHFYSPFISSAQRLPNGNTLITEGSDGRLLEVTADHELVWEYISPYWGQIFPINMVYRAYRYPYDYVPQLEKPAEVAIERISEIDFRMPGAKGKEPQRRVKVAGTKGYKEVFGFCVQTEE
ncbi:MAG: aryl-sulfate sulfotransferase [Peptococcaceae bacterium]